MKILKYNFDVLLTNYNYIYLYNHIYLTNLFVIKDSIYDKSIQSVFFNKDTFINRCNAFLASKNINSDQIFITDQKNIRYYYSILHLLE